MEMKVKWTVVCIWETLYNSLIFSMYYNLQCVGLSIIMKIKKLPVADEE